MRRFISTLIAGCLALVGLTILTSPAAAARPAPTAAHIVTVDVSRAGRLPVSKAISAWNAGLTSAQLVAASSCAGPGCIHVVEVFDGPTFLCSNPWGCGSSGGLRDGSCTVEVDRGAILELDRRQYGNPRDFVMSITLHEMGHVITGRWLTDGSMGFDCVGLSHDQRATSVMQNPLGVPPPTVPDAQNYADANALDFAT